MKNYRGAFAGPNPIIKNDNIPSRIKKVLSEEEGHNAATREFLESILVFAQNKGGLTKNQLRYFEKIESSFTEEAKKKRQEFIDSLSEKDWEDWRIAIEYYKNKGHYFVTIAERASQDPNFKPSSEQFQKIVQNKYSQKIINNARSKPKYEVGSYVQFRNNQNARLNVMKEFGLGEFNRSEYNNIVSVVIQTDVGIPKEARNGSKRYLVLPFGAKKPIEVTESDIKKAKK